MFNKARLKLTAWYLLIIIVISVSFSAFIYKVLTDEVIRFAHAQQIRIERRLEEGNYFVTPNHLANTPPPLQLTLSDPDLITESQHRLILILLMVDGGIILVSGGLSYFLAGWT